LRKVARIVGTIGMNLPNEAGENTMQLLLVLLPWWRPASSKLRAIFLNGAIARFD
jgi:hypothetical protein